jgi:hypothetical protein
MPEFDNPEQNEYRIHRSPFLQRKTNNGFDAATGRNWLITSDDFVNVLNYDRYRRHWGVWRFWPDAASTDVWRLLWARRTPFFSARNAGPKLYLLIRIIGSLRSVEWIILTLFPTDGCKILIKWLDWLKAPTFIDDRYLKKNCCQAAGRS